MSVQNSTSTSYPNTLYHHEMLPTATVAIYQAFIIITMILGIPGNILVILVNIRMDQKSPTDSIITYMSICDLIALLIVAPLRLSDSTKFWYFIASDWLCKMKIYVGQVTTWSSAFILAILAFERYLRVCRNKATIQTRRAAWKRCIVTTLVTVIITVPNCVIHGTNSNEDCGVKEGINRKLVFFYVIGLALIMIFLSVLIMCLYCLIARKVRIHSKQFETNTFTRSNSKTTKMSQSESQISLSLSKPAWLRSNKVACIAMRQTQITKATVCGSSDYQKPKTDKNPDNMACNAKLRTEMIDEYEFKSHKVSENRKSVTNNLETTHQSHTNPSEEVLETEFCKGNLQERQHKPCGNEMHLTVPPTYSKSNKKKPQTEIKSTDEKTRSVTLEQSNVTKFETINNMIENVSYSKSNKEDLINLSTAKTDMASDSVANMNDHGRNLIKESNTQGNTTTTPPLGYDQTKVVNFLSKQSGSCSNKNQILMAHNMSQDRYGSMTPVETVAIPTQTKTMEHSEKQQSKQLSDNSSEYGTQVKQTSTGMERLSKKNKELSMKTTKILFSVSLIFILSWIPPWVAFIISSAFPGKISSTLYQANLFMVRTHFISLFMNPILYYYMNLKFKAQVWKLLEDIKMRLRCRCQTF